MACCVATPVRTPVALLHRQCFVELMTDLGGVRCKRPRSCKQYSAQYFVGVRSHCPPAAGVWFFDASFATRAVCWSWLGEQKPALPGVKTSRQLCSTFLEGRPSPQPARILEPVRSLNNLGAGRTPIHALLCHAAEFSHSHSSCPVRTSCLTLGQGDCCPPTSRACG